MKRIVLAPHVDDDVIGAAGSLDADTLVFYCGVDDFHRVESGERLEEATDVAEITGHRFCWPFDSYCAHTIERHDHRVNHFDFQALKHDFELLLNQHSPDEVLLPWPSYNQDHQTVYDAAMVALRPHDEIPFVKRVLLYEEPDCFWPRIGAMFTPTLFRPIDIERKIQLYELMKSQVRGMRSSEHLRALACVRGAAANVDYAEAYHILRWVE